MISFTAIDFETAQGYRHSICQVGLVKVENGIITQTLDLLVQPPDNYYWDVFTDIHGISENMTKRAPTFDKVWHQIEPFIKNQNVVAHNGFSFDFQCLNKTLEYYGLATVEYTPHCTCNLYGRQGLKDLCEEYNIELNHHDALSDAKACAKLFLLHLAKEKIS
jgi:DNA polymerase-3 subunit epsilon